MEPYLSRLTLRDLKILGDMPGYASLRSLARSKNMTAPHLSRIIQQIEEVLEIKIIQRASTGITLTQKGRKLSLICRKVLKDFEAITEEVSPSDLSAYQKYYVIGSRSFLNIGFAGAIAQYVDSLNSELGIQIVDLSPDDTMRAARNDGIDLTINVDRLDMGKNWFQKKVGNLAWGLYARTDHPILRTKEVSALRQYRIVQATFWDGERIVRSGDLTPIAQAKKVRGFETQTALAAAEMVVNSDQLAYIPDIVARKYQSTNTLQQVALSGIKKTYTPIYVAAHQDRVTKNFLSGFVTAIERALTWVNCAKSRHLFFVQGAVNKNAGQLKSIKLTSIRRITRFLGDQCLAS